MSPRRSATRRPRPTNSIALVSFHCKTGAIATATLTKKHKAKDYAGAKAEIARWMKNNGTVMRGLVRRRDAETAQYAKA
jgi:lysozyme